MSASRLDPNDTNGLRGLRGLLTGDERIRGEQMQRIAGSAEAADEVRGAHCQPLEQPISGALKRGKWGRKRVVCASAVLP